MGGVDGDTFLVGLKTHARCRKGGLITVACSLEPAPHGLPLSVMGFAKRS
jgi:hypothetical protein